MQNNSSRDALRKFYQIYGSHVDFNLTGHLPYLKGCGPYEKIIDKDSKKTRYLILPKMQVNLNRPTRFVNHETKTDNMKKLIKRGQDWQVRNFIKGMKPLNTECLSGPSYYFENGWRRVEPYFDCISSRVASDKYPGSGIALADYFNTRFPAFTREFFEILIRNNQIAVNTEHVDPEYVIKDGDVLSHLHHKHENDVLDLKVDTIFENDDFVVVDKPSSWPVYPIGNYRFNTLQYILLREYGYSDIRTVHRIDAATSGICILAKKSGVTANLQKYFMQKTTKKQYLALVDGKFHEGEIVCEEPLNYFKISPRKFIKETSAKAATTIFQHLSYDEMTNTSLLLCIPVTGRTHQIRLHLAHLGFYIVNDSLYNEVDYEDERTEYPQEEIQKLLNIMKQEEKSHLNAIVDPSIEFKHQYCLKCQSPHLFMNQFPSSMCLHSYRYSLGDDFYFESNLPSWAENPSSILNTRKLNSYNNG